MEEAIPEQQAYANGVVEEPQAAEAAATTGNTDAGQSITETPAVPAVPPNPLLEKYNEYWGIVRENPGDFQTWTQLIATAEKLDDITKAREVFDNFLIEYPLCYGYWKKYADAENKHQNTELAAQVYQRGVASVPYSVDLWGHYATFKQQQPGATAEQTRSVFEMAVDYVGGDYLAHSLWDKYLQFESAQGSTVHVASLYSRILSYPIRDLDRYHQSFKEFVAAQIAAGIMTIDEMNALKDEIEVKKTAAREMERAAAAERAVAAAAAKAAEAEAAAAAAAAAEVAAAEAAAKPAEEGIETADGADMMDSTSKPEEVADAAHAADATTPMETSAATEPAEIKMEEAPSTEVKQEGEEAGVQDVKTEPAPTEETAAVEHTESVTNAVEAKPEGDAMAVDAAAAATESAPGEGEEAAAAADDNIVVTDDELKAAWLQLREDLYKRTKEELAKRKPYEDQIKRPYFHVKPLDNTQLTNWAKYLDFTEKQGNVDACIHLYERCLVACAAYPEFWQRYTRFLERNKAGTAAGALQRAVQVFCKRRADMHLFAARYQERYGETEAARATYHHLLTQLSPGLLPALTAAANFEHRMGNRDGACQLYEDVIREERAKESSSTYTFLVVQYAHFLLQMYRDITKAREALDEALSHMPASRTLCDGAIFLEEVARAADMQKRVLALYERFTAQPSEPGKGLPEREREELSTRAVEFADMYGDAATLAEVEYAHAARFMLPSTIASEASRKRTASEAGVSGPASKQAKSDIHASVSVPLPSVPSVPPPVAAAPPVPAVSGMPPAPMAAAGYYGQPAAPAAPYNYAAYYGQYPGYAGYGYGY